mmetsp:Transcript_560/g.1004  ORF Transcript_560/g.1004 Transcript_560/m.1004 type:complete len:210 (-) Transcript_560:202-831(-)
MTWRASCSTGRRTKTARCAICATPTPRTCPARPPSSTNRPAGSIRTTLAVTLRLLSTSTQTHCTGRSTSGTAAGRWAQSARRTLWRRRASTSATTTPESTACTRDVKIKTLKGRTVGRCWACPLKRPSATHSTRTAKTISFARRTRARASSICPPATSPPSAGSSLTFTPAAKRCVRSSGTEPSSTRPTSSTLTPGRSKRAPKTPTTKC